MGGLLAFDEVGEVVPLVGGKWCCGGVVHAFEVIVEFGVRMVGGRIVNVRTPSPRHGGGSKDSGGETDPRQKEEGFYVELM